MPRGAALIFHDSIPALEGALWCARDASEARTAVSHRRPVECDRRRIAATSTPYFPV